MRSGGILTSLALSCNSGGFLFLFLGGGGEEDCIKFVVKTIVRLFCSFYHIQCRLRTHFVVKNSTNINGVYKIS